MFARLAFVLSALTAVALAGVAAPPQCDRYYVVEAGDNCDIISAKTSSSTYQLARVNTGIINSQCTNLTVGELICLGLEGQDCEVTHVVQSDEVCVDIANNAGILLSTLLANNPNVDSQCSNIYPGEVLCAAAVLIHYT